MASTSHYPINQVDCNGFDAFVADLSSRYNTKPEWFEIARRFLLYGGSKEFNTHFDEVDRIVDYNISLESTLVFEGDFVSRRLRERAIRLLKLVDEHFFNLLFRRVRN